METDNIFAFVVALWALRAGVVYMVPALSKGIWLRRRHTTALPEAKL